DQRQSLHAGQCTVRSVCLTLPACRDRPGCSAPGSGCSSPRSCCCVPYPHLATRTSDAPDRNLAQSEQCVSFGGRPRRWSPALTIQGTRTVTDTHFVQAELPRALTARTRYENFPTPQVSTKEVVSVPVVPTVVVRINLLVIRVWRWISKPVSFVERSTHVIRTSWVFSATAVTDPGAAGCAMDDEAVSVIWGALTSIPV